MRAQVLPLAGMVGTGDHSLLLGLTSADVPLSWLDLPVVRAVIQSKWRGFA
jgi:hypothetical protein